MLALSTQMVKNLPAMQKTRVQSLGWEEALEKGMANHSSILAWRIPWTDHGAAESDMAERLTYALHIMPLCSPLAIKSHHNEILPETEL